MVKSTSQIKKLGMPASNPKNQTYFKPMEETRGPHYTGQPKSRNQKVEWSSWENQPLLTALNKILEVLERIDKKIK